MNKFHWDFGLLMHKFAYLLPRITRWISPLTLEMSFVQLVRRFDLSVTQEFVTDSNWTKFYFDFDYVLISWCLTQFNWIPSIHSDTYWTVRWIILEMSERFSFRFFSIMLPTMRAIRWWWHTDENALPKIQLEGFLISPNSLIQSISATEWKGNAIFYYVKE